MYINKVVDNYNMRNTFLKTIGDSPHSRILEFLIIGRNFEYSFSDLERDSELNLTKLHQAFPAFEKQKLIVQTRKHKGSKLFKLNLENEYVKLLVKLFDTIMAKELDEIAEKHSQMVKVKAK